MSNRINEIMLFLWRAGLLVALGAIAWQMHVLASGIKVRSMPEVKASVDVNDFPYEALNVDVQAIPSVSVDSMPMLDVDLIGTTDVNVGFSYGEAVPVSITSVP